MFPLDRGQEPWMGMEQWLHLVIRVLTAAAEVTCLVSSIHVQLTTDCNSRSKGSNPLSGHCRHLQTCCLNHFPIAVKSYHDLGDLEQKELIWGQCSKGWVYFTSGQGAWQPIGREAWSWCSRWELTSALPGRGEGVGRKTDWEWPHSLTVVSDTPPPRPPLLILPK